MQFHANFCNSIQRILTVNILMFQFLAELTKLFQKARAEGSVTMTMKRCKQCIFQHLIRLLCIFCLVTLFICFRRRTHKAGASGRHTSCKKSRVQMFDKSTIQKQENIYSYRAERCGTIQYSIFKFTKNKCEWVKTFEEAQKESHGNSVIVQAMCHETEYKLSAHLC